MSQPSHPVASSPSPAVLAATLNAAAGSQRAATQGAELARRLALVREHIDGKIVFTTSFGIEDQAIAHAIFTEKLALDVVTLDTGRLFPETRDVWAETERRYGRHVAAFNPETRDVETLLAQQGVDGFRDSVANRQACCGVRKVVPLGRALEGASAWVTGLRGDQSAQRSHTPFAEVDAARNLIKINPLFDWTRDDVAAFVHAEHIPYNSLHDRGFLSIGCAPCTRAVKPGEPERAGRWWWEQEDKKECGLHFATSASGAPVVVRRPATHTSPEHVS